MVAWTLFHNPITLSACAQLWLLLPLLLSVSIIYKTIRVKRLKRLPLEAARMFAEMVGGLVVLGVALWLILEYVV